MCPEFICKLVVSQFHTQAGDKCQNTIIRLSRAAVPLHDLVTVSSGSTKQNLEPIEELDLGSLIRKC